jgi:L-threonylcarbamoyladenylate synthase
LGKVVIWCNFAEKLMTGVNINTAAAFLRAGELVAIPTETVYGLAANAFDEAAVIKIYKAKNRPQFNPLIIHTDSLEKLQTFGIQLPAKAKLLAAHFSPGPLTYVVPKSDKIPDIITAGTNAVAVRIPNHQLTLALLAQLDFPLAAPSANPSGFVSPTSAAHVAAQLQDKVAYILDGGACEVGVESTIISFLNDEPEILRFGGLALEDIEAVIGKVKIPVKGYSDNPVAPGMLARHYATRHPIVLGDISSHIARFSPEQIATISLSQKFEQIPDNQQFILSENNNLDEAASRLFAAMREADALNVDVILAQIFPNEGLGRAINDRLKRAATLD